MKHKKVAACNKNVTTFCNLTAPLSIWVKPCQKHQNFQLTYKKSYPLSVSNRSKLKK